MEKIKIDSPCSLVCVFFLILKDEDFNSGGSQSIIRSLLLQKGKEDMLLSAQRGKVSFSPTPHLFLFKIQGDCWPCKKMRNLRKEGV